jgi:hypothetical protein
MAKEKSEEAKRMFIDRTDEKWLVKKEENEVTFCKSVEDLLSGKKTSSRFLESRVSARTAENKRTNEQFEKNSYVIFVLEDGTIVLVKKYMELK